MRLPSIVMFLQLVVLLQCHAFALAQSVSERTHKKSDADAVAEFLRDLPSESSFSNWLVENGPVYGNYCGSNNGAADFEEPCLSRVDCICKAQDFGGSLRKYAKTDLAFLNRSLGSSFVLVKQDPKSERLLESMTIKLFAASLIGVDISEGVKTAHASYQKDPQTALVKLNQIIDHDEVFRKKIETINIERLRFEEQKLEGSQVQETKPKKMAVSIHPFHLIFGLFYVNYEHRLSNTLSLRLGTSVFATGLITDTYLGYGNNNKNFSTFFSVGLKTFFLGETLKSGIYVEPVLEVGYENVANLINPSARDRDIALVPAVLFGMEKIFFSGFQVDVGFGAGYHFGIPVSTASFSTFFLVPKVRASVGWAW